MKSIDTKNVDKDPENFHAGKVFIEVTPYSGDKLNDDSSKNFHICPADKKYWEPISKEYRAMRKRLKEAFEKFFNEIKEGNRVVPEHYPRIYVTTIHKTLKALQNDPEYCSDTIYSRFGSGSNGGRDVLSVYKYFAVIYKGAWYRLNFMRMYHDGKYIHCHMNELQYDKDLTNNAYGLNISGICYPCSCHDGEFGWNNAGNVVYNPEDVSYPHVEKKLEEIKPEFFLEIVTSFLSFVVDKSNNMSKGSV